MSKTIEEVLSPLREAFMIEEDGSSQTRLSNHGRVGFHVDRLFGIVPNNLLFELMVTSDIKTCYLTFPKYIIFI